MLLCEGYFYSTGSWKLIVDENWLKLKGSFSEDVQGVDSDTFVGLSIYPSCPVNGINIYIERKTRTELKRTLNLAS